MCHVLPPLKLFIKVFATTIAAHVSTANDHATPAASSKITLTVSFGVIAVTAHPGKHVQLPPPHQLPPAFATARAGAFTFPQQVFTTIITVNIITIPSSPPALSGSAPEFKLPEVQLPSVEIALSSTTIDGVLREQGPCCYRCISSLCYFMMLTALTLPSGDMIKAAGVVAVTRNLALLQTEHLLPPTNRCLRFLALQAELLVLGSLGRDCRLPEEEEEGKAVESRIQKVAIDGC
ncbi:hypothetical protein Taro_031943 [Colocasia esculenta]|uniref:Secreted protein n=1 Tax=Colocasia esculenta TaxID=4460 RepID=A0A843VK34_COLES|nr:hypothetical protein [Colocasia esculenta]